MSNIGIVEGFFGPEWSTEGRLVFAPFLQKYGGSFYIYAPKRDAHLRKNWRDKWENSYLQKLITLRDTYQKHNLKFGVAISPFGLGNEVSEEDWQHLKHKFQLLSEMKLDYLGLFFDDMPITDALLKVQTEVVEVARSYFPRGLIFCPSYYTFDPILDKVFGQRPVGYVEGLKDAIPDDVDICWTGPKVISEEISAEHLQVVKSLLGRNPFIWENLYANDGPRNCKFLKLKFFHGRDQSLNLLTSGVGFNLMNQPYLSQVLFLSSLFVMKHGIPPEKAFEKSCHELLTSKFADFLLAHRKEFLEVGFDQLSHEQKTFFLHEVSMFNEPAAQEVKAWLSGEYLVGPECLTD